MVVVMVVTMVVTVGASSSTSGHITCRVNQQNNTVTQSKRAVGSTQSIR